MNDVYKIVKIKMQARFDSNKEVNPIEPIFNFFSSKNHLDMKGITIYTFDIDLPDNTPYATLETGDVKIVFLRNGLALEGTINEESEWKRIAEEYIRLVVDYLNINGVSPININMGIEATFDRTIIQQLLQKNVLIKDFSTATDVFVAWHNKTDFLDITMAINTEEDSEYSSVTASVENDYQDGSSLNCSDITAFLDDMEDSLNDMC